MIERTVDGTDVLDILSKLPTLAGVLRFEIRHKGLIDASLAPANPSAIAILDQYDCMGR